MNELGQFSLSQLLELECDSELLDIACPDTDLPAWAFIRLSFLRTVISKTYYANSLVGARGYWTGAAKKAGYLSRALLHNFAARRNAVDVCFFSTALGNYNEDGQTHDRLVGYFAQACPVSTIINQGYGDWSWPTKFTSSDLFFATPSKLYAHLVGRIRVDSHHRNVAAGVIDRAAENVRLAIDFELEREDKAALVRKLSHQMATFPTIVSYYKRWFEARKVRLLLLEDGCFGGGAVGVIHAARMAGVVTAEFQHGMISKGHDGYNVGESLIHHAGFKRTLPEYLLTYGRWWASQTNMPIVKLPIGNPHLIESGYKAGTSGERHRVISDSGESH
jgi:hypothetical protein